MNMDIRTINDRLRADAYGYMRQAEEEFDARLPAVAQDIRDKRAQCPIILIAGPSGSGKTTTARKLEEKLDAWGCEAHALSLDNYFVPLSEEQQLLAAAGKLDLESPDRVDIPFLNQQLEGIIAGRPPPIPHFNFTDNSRTHSGHTLTRKPGDLVILEGIHALNPAVITLPEAETQRLYVSVRTRLVTDNGEALHPKRIRLLRRMLRDKLFRNRSVEHTLRMFGNVQRGENRYIMPYKARSTHDIDTFCPYEVSVYKDELLEELQTLENRADARELLELLAQVTIAPASLVPPDALIREFIGPPQ